MSYCILSMVERNKNRRVPGAKLYRAQFTIAHTSYEYSTKLIVRNGCL